MALWAVVLSAGCAGTANVLQAREARRVRTVASLSPSLMVRLLARAGYRAALALLGVGMLLALYALRVLPVFLVQAGRSASLGVTAVLSVLVLGARPRRSEFVAVAVTVGGLVALVLSTAPQLSVQVPDGPRLALIGAVAAVTAAGVWASRAGPGARSGVTLAALAGLCYAIVAVAGRTLRGVAPLTLVWDPSAWAMALAGLLGLLLTASALQRASAVTVTGVTVGTETVVAAVLGVLLCGDRPAAGGTAYAVVGFALVLAGALALARFGGPLDDTAGVPSRERTGGVREDATP